MESTKTLTVALLSLVYAQTCPAGNVSSVALVVSVLKFAIIAPSSLSPPAPSICKRHVTMLMHVELYMAEMVASFE